MGKPRVRNDIWICEQCGSVELHGIQDVVIREDWQLMAKALHRITEEPFPTKYIAQKALDEIHNKNKGLPQCAQTNILAETKLKEKSMKAKAKAPKKPAPKAAPKGKKQK